MATHCLPVKKGNRMGYGDAHPSGKGRHDRIGEDNNEEC